MARPAGFRQVTLSPAQFVSNCESMHGTVKRSGDSSITCTLPSGLTVSCTFNSGQALCQWGRALPSGQLEDLLGDGPQSMNPDPGPPQSLTSSDSGGSDSVNQGPSTGGGSGGKGSYAGGAGGGSGSVGDGGGGPVVK
jgi:hypothetical protein